MTLGLSRSRRATIAALRAYMAQGPDASARVRTALDEEFQDQGGFAHHMLVGFTPEEAARPDLSSRLVELLAPDQASLGLEYSRAQRELQRLSLVADRERIAKELHDGVIQALFAVGLGLQGTAAIVVENRVAERLQDAVNEIDRVISDLRSYIFGLRPHVLSSTRGLGEALDLRERPVARWGVAL